jgi:TolB protein
MKSRISIFLVAAALALSGLPAYATFPGENGKIVFVSDRSGSWQLYTIDPDGRDMTQITSLPPTDYDLWAPTFSPDGKQILFVYGAEDSDGNFPSDVYVINAGGTGLKRLTNDGLVQFARWAPDAQHIAIARAYPPTGINRIAILRADGVEESPGLTSPFWDSFAPTYAPGGRHIVFYTEKGGLISAVWIMKADGANKRRLTPAPIEAFPWDVSPDGKQILMTDHQNTSLPTAIYSMDIDGQNIKRLTSIDNVHELAGTYSPNGRKIVFFSDRLNSRFTFDLFTMNPDGSDIRRIAVAVGTCPDMNCVDATWGPRPGK